MFTRCIVQLWQRLVKGQNKRNDTVMTRCSSGCSCGSRCIGWGVAVALVSGISTVAITVTDVRQRNAVSTLTVQLTHPVTHWITWTCRHTLVHLFICESIGYRTLYKVLQVAAHRCDGNDIWQVVARGERTKFPWTESPSDLGQNPPTTTEHPWRW